MQMYTWCFNVAKLLVCIGDCGMTPFDGGIPIRPHNKTCNTFNISNICKKPQIKFSSWTG